MSDALGRLIESGKTKDFEQAEQAMRDLKVNFMGPDIIEMAYMAGWRIPKKSELAEYLLSPGYAPGIEDGE